MAVSTVAAYLILAVWTAGFMADIFLVDYDPPAVISPLMILVAGWLFGLPGKGTADGTRSN